MPDIKLRNGSGVEQVYSGVDSITVPLADGSGYHTFGLTDEDLTFVAGGSMYLFTPNTERFVKDDLARIKFVPVTHSDYTILFVSDLIRDSSISDFSPVVLDCEGIDIFMATPLITSGGSVILEKLPTVINNGNTAISAYSLLNNATKITIEELLKFFSGFTYSTNMTGLGGSGSSVRAYPYYGKFENILDFSELNAKWHKIINNEKSYKNYSSSPEYGHGMALDYVKSHRNIPIQYTDTTKRTSGFTIFQSYNPLSFSDSYAFATDNGTPYSMNWKGITLDISSANNSSYPLGWKATSYSTNFEAYAGGYWKKENNVFADDPTTIEAAQAAYNAVKNKEGWYSNTIRSVTYEGKSCYLGQLFSRYNHDSAVETINSLPDTSAYLATAGGTNIIKFKGVQGALTDGGAISTLTTEEIAVAAAKGWTVSLT